MFNLYLNIFGQRNSGKGLLTKAFRDTFEGYIDEYDANNLLYNQSIFLYI